MLGKGLEEGFDDESLNLVASGFSRKVTDSRVLPPKGGSHKREGRGSHGTRKIDAIEIVHRRGQVRRCGLMYPRQKAWNLTDDVIDDDNGGRSLGQ